MTCVVGGMDIPTIKNVKVGLQTLRLLDVPSSRLHLLLNRANTKVKVEIQEIERTLQLRAEALMPSDILVPIRSTRVSRGDRGAPFGRLPSITQMADTCCRGRSAIGSAQ